MVMSVMVLGNAKGSVLPIKTTSPTQRPLGGSTPRLGKIFSYIQGNRASHTQGCGEVVLASGNTYKDKDFLVDKEVSCRHPIQ